MPRRKFRFTLTSLPILILLIGLIGPAFGVSGQSAGPAAASAAGKIAPEVLAQLDREGMATFLVYLAEQADLSPAYRIRHWDARGWFVLDALRGVAQRTQPAVLSALDDLRIAGHLSYVHPHYAINLIVVRGSPEAARTIARLPEVAAIYPEVRIEPVRPVATAWPGVGPQAVEWNVAKIRADQVWSTYGITGTGTVVANIDSGVEYTHPALVEQYRGNLGGGSFDHDYSWWDPTGQYAYPAPIDGPYPLGSSHGTHTMGVIVGDDGVGNQIGVAPGARWIAAYGFSGLDGLLSATEWMIAPWQVNDFDPGHPTADPTKRPHTVNNSWGAPGGLLLFEPLLEAQRASGIFPTFAAGNNGLNGCGTMIAPADNPSGFAVGATGTNDEIAFFSSRGPNALRSWMGLYGIGPDVTAPGYPIRTSHPGGGYSSGGGGTSYASPHVAGTVALLWSAEPDIIGRVEETAEILRGTAVPRTTGEECGGVPGSEVPNNTFGWGRIDALAAVEMVWQAGTLAGTVTDAVTAAPVPEARVLMERSGYTLATATDSAGDYAFPLGQGTYTVTVQAYGYQPWTTTGVGVLQDLTTTLDVALTPLLTHTLSGVVQEGTLLAPGDPVWARVGVRDTPVEVTTDPASGAYSAPIAEGGYTMRVIARGYVPENRAITVTAGLTESFSLQPRRTYYVRDSRSPCGPTFNWIDATDGTPHYLSFQDFVEIYEPDHAFTFYDSPNTLYYVSSNGFLSFGQGYPEHVQDLPQMVIPHEGPANNAIYGFEEMLNPALGGQGTVYHKIVDDRYVVIEFHQVEHWVSGFPETFEFVLDTETGIILLQYLEVSQPDWATVGVENQDGSEGVLYSYHNSAEITNSLAVAFYPVFGPPPTDQDTGGVLGTLSGTVYVSGTTPLAGTPIPGAVVTATSFLHAFSTTADPAGRYLFPDICADLYWLQPAAPGHYPGDPVQARLRWPGDVVVTGLFLERLPAAPVLTKTVAPTEVRYADLLTFTLSLANEGEGDLVGAVLSDTLPWIVGYITSTPPGFYQDHTLTWTVDISAGGAGEVTILGFLIPPPAEAPSAIPPSPAATLTNTAYLLWEGPTISASASFETIWVPWRAPVLAKTVAVTQVLPGEFVTFTLAYGNEGYDGVYGAVISDVLPQEVAYVTSTPPGSYQDGVLTWTVDISAYGAGEVMFVGQLSPVAVPSTTVSNTAYLLWDGPAVSDTASFLVGEPACWVVRDPAIAWAPLLPRVGEVVTFTGTVAAGDPPITYSWRLDVGSWKEGEVVTHSYALPGEYSVVMTATNCGGAGVAVVSETLTVRPEVYQIYLPFVPSLRSGQAERGRRIGGALTSPSPQTVRLTATSLDATIDIRSVRKPFGGIACV